MEPEKKRDRKPAAIDPAAWVDNHGDVLYWYARARVRSDHAAEDLVQETFLAALAGKKSFRGESAERTWLVGILRHKVLDHLRAAGRLRPVGEIMGTDAEIDALYTDRGSWKKPPRDWGGEPEAVLDRAEFWEVFDECLGGMPPRLAEAFSLRVIDGMESAEVCKVLGSTATNIWVMLHRARARLRACLEANWFCRGAQEKTS